MAQLRDIPHLTDDELRRALSDAEAQKGNAETDSSWFSWDQRAEALYRELERRERVTPINDTLAASADAIARVERLAGLS